LPRRNQALEERFGRFVGGFLKKSTRIRVEIAAQNRLPRGGLERPEESATSGKAGGLRKEERFGKCLGLRTASPSLACNVYPGCALGNGNNANDDVAEVKRGREWIGHNRVAVGGLVDDDPG